MKRAGLTIKRLQILPSNATERAVYCKATIGPEGAEIVLGKHQDPGSLRVPMSAYAAALEELARAIRIALIEQEQHAIQKDAGEPASVRAQGPINPLAAVTLAEEH